LRFTTPKRPLAVGDLTALGKDQKRNGFIAGLRFRRRVRGQLPLAVKVKKWTTAGYERPFAQRLIATLRPTESASREKPIEKKQMEFAKRPGNHPRRRFPRFAAEAPFF